MEIGNERVIQNGANGCRSVAYKILILNGNVVSQDILSEDTYSAMNRIIERGTKGHPVVKTDPEPVTTESTPSASTEQISTNVEL